MKWRVAVGAASVAIAALGAVVVGAFAIGAMAMGALVIDRLGVGRARFERLEIDELVVRKLTIMELHCRSRTRHIFGASGRMTAGPTRKERSTHVPAIAGRNSQNRGVFA
jgi:hypothetical protein